MSASAENMRRVVEAKATHENDCPFNGTAIAVLLSPVELERLGWEDGDDIAGISVVGATEMGTGRMTIGCDGDFDDRATIREIADAHDHPLT